MSPRLRSVGIALLALIAIIVLGGWALFLLGDHDYPFWQCVYFAMYTVTTVGFAEMPDMGNHIGLRLATGVLMLSGVGALAFFQSTLTVMLVEGVIAKAFRRRRMQRKLSKMSQHVVITGFGRTGRYVIDDLLRAEHDIVVVDRDQAVLDQLAEEMPEVPFVHGDATEDSVLTAAGAALARGVVACLSEDRDNLFVTLSVRAMNPEARIVAKVADVQNERKVIRAGADATVNPNRIGGMRLASELVRPHVTEFLDEMLRVTEGRLTFEEVTLPPDTPLAGRTLRDAPIRTETNLLVVAVRKPDGGYLYNPPPDHPLASGERLIVIGQMQDVSKLRRMVSGQKPSEVDGPRLGA